MSTCAGREGEEREEKGGGKKESLEWKRETVEGEEETRKKVD